LLVPAQNMMRREKALWWQGRHNEIRACRARETGMWLASADVTGGRDDTHLGLGPTGFLNPTGEVVDQVPVGVPGMVTADINPPTQSNINDA
jgi:predicted amidohydrolase